MTYGGEAQQLEVLRVKWSSLEEGALRGAGLVPTVSGTEGAVWAAAGAGSSASPATPRWSGQFWDMPSVPM